jgi:hypothetical protein
MPVDALPCVKCGKPLRNVEDACYNQPSGGTEFSSLGHYGSTIHDELFSDQPMLLLVNICDTCILRAIDEGLIQSRSQDGQILMANHHVSERARAWVLAQNEKQYGSAWGDDVPIDYREEMLKAGWPEQMLDAEENEPELDLS